MRSILLTFAFLNVFIWCNGQRLLDKLNIPPGHQQVILVTTNSWSDSTGALQSFSRTEAGWSPESHPIAVMVGRNGLTWGRGLHVSKEPEKVEGDGKAPAGIFELAGAFGYEKEPSDIRLSYRQVTQRDYWVDDPGSAEYNQWVSIPDDQENKPADRWGSFERMLRDDDLYEVGIIIKHNISPIAAGKGSAIFMHIWRGPGSATSGCTAMPKDDLVNLMEWLDPDLQPLLIQVPVTEFNELKFRD